VRAARVYVSAPDVVTVLATTLGAPDPRHVELDEWGKRVVGAWARTGRPDPADLEQPKPAKARRRSRAKPHTPDPRVSRPVTKSQETQALAVLAARFVRPAFLERWRCVTCKARCRCEWRSEVWLELVNPPTSAAPVDDIVLRVERAIGRTESRSRRAWGADAAAGEACADAGDES
jgi:hypothetical protein